MIPPAVRELAEDPTAHAPAPPGFERVQNERYSLMLGPFDEAMALTREPEAAGGELEAHLAQDFDEFTTASQITWEAFGFPYERREEERAILPVLFELHNQGLAPRYVCFLDGEPVASALAVFADAA